MVKNLTQPTFFASMTPPNPVEITYWIDLGANARGNIIKFWDGNINQWVKLTDASSEYAVSPKIGLNGNWFVDNRDTGIPAYGYVPIIGDNGNWWEWSSEDLMYKDTGHSAVGETGATGPTGAEGKSAYDSAVDSGFVGTESEWIASLSAASEEAAEVALLAASGANTAAENANTAIELANVAISEVNEAVANSITATGDAVDATNSAMAATESANEAANLANLMATNAQESSNLANQAAIEANEAAINAGNAADLANSATTNAEIATNAANVATTSTQTAIDNAITATINADTAAFAANTAAQLAIDAAENVEDGKTPTFGEISATPVPNSQPPSFEFTNTGQVDAEGNPIWVGTLNVPIGEPGKSPYFETGTVTTGNPGTNASVTLTENGVTADGRPKVILSMTIPRGAQGEPGEGSGNVVLTNPETGETIKQYVLRPGANGSLNYSIEEIEVNGPELLSVVYVSKTGNDLNNGRSILKPKLTIASAIIEASAMIVGDIRQASVVVLDAGTYTETVTLVDDVHLIAERATIVGRINLRNRTRVSVYSHYAAASSTYLVYKDGTEHAYYNAVVCDGRGVNGDLTTVTNVYNITGSSITFVDIQLMYVSASGIGIREESSGYGHIHFNIKDLYLAGNNSTAIRASGTASNIVGYVDHILEIGSPTNTTAFDLRNASCVVKATCGEIISDRLWSIIAGDLYLVCPKTEGTKTGVAKNFISGDYGDLKNAPTWDVTTQALTIDKLNVGNIIQTGLQKITSGTSDTYKNILTYKTAENLTGYCIITTPISIGQMMWVKFRVYRGYNEPTQFAEVNLNVYMASPVNNMLPSYTIVGRHPGLTNLRTFIDTTNSTIAIVFGTNNFAWPAATIVDIIEAVKNGNASKDLTTGWSVSFEETLPETYSYEKSAQLSGRTLNTSEIATKLNIPKNSVPYNNTSSDGEPTDSLKVSQTTEASTLALRTSGGQIAIAAPTDNTHAATKLYVDNGLSTKGNVTITNPAELQANVPVVLVPSASSNPSVTAQEAVVGGRNLLIGTGTDEWDAYNSNSIVSATQGISTKIVRATYSGTANIFGIAQSTANRKSKFEYGKKYIASFLIRGNISGLNYCYVMNPTGGGNDKLTVRTESAINEDTFVMATCRFTGTQYMNDSAYSYLLIAIIGEGEGKWFEIQEVKVEEGHIRSAWTPAPEDLDVITNAAQLLKDVPYVLTPNSNGSKQHTAQEAVVGGRNLSKNYNSPSLFVPYGDSVLTRSVVEVPEWGATDANRIVSSGGTSAIKALRTFGLVPVGLKRTASVWVKNNSDKILTVYSNLGNLTVDIAPGESKLVIFRYATTGGSAHIQFRAPSASDDIDVTWWRIMYEEGHIPSTAVPAPEDMATKQTIAQNTVLGRTDTGNGEPNVGIPFSQTATANTLVQRNANSRIEAEAATTNKEVVNLGQLNERFNGNYEIVVTLPAVGEEGKMYLKTTTTENVYDLFTWKPISGVYQYVSLGSTSIDLSQYAKTTDVNSSLALKANIASPTFTGIPESTTAEKGNNSTQIATTAFVQNELTDFVKDSELDIRLLPIDESLNTISGNIDNKVDKVSGKGLSTNDFTDEDKSKLDWLSTHTSITTGNIDCSLGSTFTITASADLTISLSNLESIIHGADVVIRIVSDSTSNRTITLPTTGIVNETGLSETKVVTDVKSLELNIKRFGDVFSMKGVYYE